MRFSYILLILLLSACGVHQNIRLVRNEAIVIHEEKKSSIEKQSAMQTNFSAQELITSTGNAELEKQLLLANTVQKKTYSEATLPLEANNVAQATEGDPEKEILAEALANERKAKISRSLSISSLVLDFLFPYVGFPLSIVALIYFLILNNKRYFTLKGNAMLRTSMILLIIQGALLLLLIGLILLLIFL